MYIDKNFGVERPLVTAGEKLECSQLEALPLTRKQRDRASAAPLALPC